MKLSPTMFASAPVSILVNLLLCASLAPRPVAGAAARTRSCPFASCQQGKEQAADGSESLLQLSSAKAASATQGCGPKFTPAHFTCSSCDVQTCSGCNNVICDLSKCIGKFYSQECWCTKPFQSKINKFFCDSDCSGGLCNQKGLKCKTRESACKPWWWCKLPPPKEPESFLQKAASRRNGACAKQESSSKLNARLEQARGELRMTSLLQDTSRNSKPGLKRAKNDFDFQPGSFVCESALLPPPDEDPVTLKSYAAGFIVFSKDTCAGGYFKSKCFCYDKFKYLRGEDPKTSELECDKGCGQGPCGGKTCGDAPPPPLPAPSPPPPPDPLLQELANEGMLRNYGTQMSPLT